MRVVLVSNDLMVASRIEGAARQAGSTVRVVSGGAAAVEVQSQEAADLVVVDLATPQVDVESLIEQLKSISEKPLRTLAFGPHVYEDRLAAARDAGFDTVMSRGQFFAQVNSLLVG